MAVQPFGRHLHNQIIIPLLVAAVCVAVVATFVGVYRLSQIVDSWVGAATSLAGVEAHSELEEAATELESDGKLVAENARVAGGIASGDMAAVERAFVGLRKDVDVDDVMLLDDKGRLVALTGSAPVELGERPLPDKVMEYVSVDMRFTTFLRIRDKDMLASVRSQTYDGAGRQRTYTVVLTRWITPEYLRAESRGRAAAVMFAADAVTTGAYYVAEPSSASDAAGKAAALALGKELGKRVPEVDEALANPGTAVTLFVGEKRYAVVAERVTFAPAAQEEAGRATGVLDPSEAVRYMVLFVDASLASETGTTTIGLIAFWSLVAVGALTGLGAVIARQVSAPLMLLSESARRVADGDFEARVEISGTNEVAELGESFNVMTESLKARTETLTKKVLELATLYEMSRALGSTLDLDVLLESVLDSALRIFDVDSGYVMLRDKLSGGLDLRAWRGTTPARPDDRAVRSSMSEWVVRQGRPLVFNPSLDEHTEQHVDSVTGALAALSVPLVSSEGVIGAICVGSRDRSFRFSSDDVRLLSTIANHVTIAIGNIELFSSLQDAYLATVRSLAAAVDAKDPYTRGHSDRVAAYARAIAEKLGLSGEQCTALEMAAYLHDIGKIGVRESILLKPGKLDDDEFLQMKHHPLIGANILRPVAFPWPIAPVVRHHHEHFDGKGYPAGLKGEEIPLLARILTVADAFEAMTSDRPYRSGRSQDDAIEELKRCESAHFDPRVVEAFIAALADEAVASPVLAGHTAEQVEPEEMRAIFVAVCDGMFGSFRRLGGPRLASNLEAELDAYLEGNGLPYAMRNGHMSADWDKAGPPERQLSEMRQVVRRMSSFMEGAAGGSLVDHFYAEAVSGLSERMRRLAEALDLHSGD